MSADKVDEVPMKDLAPQSTEIPMAPVAPAADETNGHATNGHAAPAVPSTPAPAPAEAAAAAPAAPAGKQSKPPKGVNIDEHLMAPEDIFERYETQYNKTKPSESMGLKQERVEHLLKIEGPNILSPPKRVHPFFKFLHCLLSLFNLLLIIAGILCYILYGIDAKANAQNVYLGAILLGVAFINAIIEFIQIQKSDSILESFKNMIPQKCYVQREGTLHNIMAADIVRGDIVVIRNGDKIPADVRVLHATDFKVDNSSLTGESEPLERGPNNTQSNPLEATNLAFFGTNCVQGEAFGVVIRCGDNTTLGQIANMAGKEKKRISPLQQEIDNFVYIMASVAIVFAIVFFIIGLRINPSISYNVNFAIGVFVAFVPQGLPVTVILLLSLAAQRLSKKNILVKDLQGVETLGAITLLASDKTGTLTRNQMAVSNMWTSLTMYATREGPNTPGVQFDLKTPGLYRMPRISCLCSRARYDRLDIPVAQRKVIGDATETGLLNFAALNVPDIDKIGDEFPKVFEVPFNSETKTALTIHKMPHDNGALMVYVKGAPERVLRLCNTIIVDDKVVPLTDEHRAGYDKAYETMASLGHRVLAMAELALPGSEYPENFEFTRDPRNYPQKNYTFVGLISLEDPPKHGVREAIGKCRQAGVQVMMVTGDHPLTAEAIARKINLVTFDTAAKVAAKTGRPITEVREDEVKAIVVHGEQIDHLTSNDWDRILSKEEVIFARTSPRHKLEIVKRSQARGHIVGVTGDGVNDSPALKKADLGIAMNLSGSDVSKEAAAMILLDDNFSSIITGIEQGRLIFVNLKKSIQYTLTHIAPEVMATLVYVVAPLPLPISPILILLIDLGFELFIAMTYSWEVPESKKGLMRVPPRKPVTDESVQRLRERNLLEPAKDPEPVEVDEEAAPKTFGEKVVDGFKGFGTSIKDFFSKITSLQYWKDRIDPPTPRGEVLVDSEVLSWAYLEGGMIEALGCLVVYFYTMYLSSNNIVTPYEAQRAASSQNADTSYFVIGNSSPYVTSKGETLAPSTQEYVIATANAAFYAGVFIQQCFNLFAMKGRSRPPIGRFVFENRTSFYGIFIGACLTAFFIYTPGVQTGLGTNNVSIYSILISCAFGCFLVFYWSVRGIVLRALRPKFDPDRLALDLHPTVMTIKEVSK